MRKNSIENIKINPCHPWSVTNNYFYKKFSLCKEDGYVLFYLTAFISYQSETKLLHLPIFQKN